MNINANAAVGAASRESIEWAAIPANRARASSVSKRFVIRSTELNPKRRPNDAVPKGCFGTRIGDAPLYISIDIDVLDPAHAPGTGTPEAGGMTSRELLRILRALADKRIVGADVVEVAPAYDHAQLTAVAASHVAYELISAMAPRTGGAEPGPGLAEGRAASS